MEISIRPNSLISRDIDSPDIHELEQLLVQEMLGGDVEDDGPLASTHGGMPFRTDSVPLARPVRGNDVFGGDSKYDEMPEARTMDLHELRQEIKSREQQVREQEEREEQRANEPQQAPVDPQFAALVHEVTGKPLDSFKSPDEAAAAVMKDERVAVRMEFLKKHPDFPASKFNGDLMEWHLANSGLEPTLENLEFAYDELKQQGAFEKPAPVARSAPKPQPQTTEGRRSQPQAEYTEDELREMPLEQMRKVINNATHKRGQRRSNVASFSTSEII